MSEKDANELDLSTNQKRSEGNKQKKKCPKCGEPQNICQFAKHVRNCDG